MPSEKDKRIIVTAALPYANGPIHVGHLVEYIQTDIYVRFLKLTGKDAIYCCADDTHGAPIEIKASELKIKPEQLIAKYYKEHLEDFSKFLIKFDSYYTTNSEENKKFSDLIFNTLKEKGFVYQKEIEVSFCQNCKRTLPDRYVKGKCPKCGANGQYGDVCESCNATYKTVDLIEPYCVICKSAPIRKKSLHYFFKLGLFQEMLDRWLVENKNLQKEVVNFVRNWIKDGLDDWCISRDGPYFGFKIPGEEDKYYYVWLDAPIGYIASTENYCKNHGLDAESDYWKSKNSEIIHFIGKDIVYFHLLFWPAVLYGSGFNLPDNIIVHGFLNVNNEKMSKSRGTFFTASEFSELYNPELLRYYYSCHLSRRLADINLDFDDFAKKVNNELVSNLANFFYRVTSFCNKNFKSEIKGIDENPELISELNTKIKTTYDKYNELNFNEAIREIMAISSLGNKYFQDNEPWKLINEDKEKVHRIVGLCINIAKNLSILVEPIMPALSNEMQRQLNVSGLKWSDINFNLTNHKINQAKSLISKIENTISKEFALDLRVAKIIEVKEHPEAEKLYVIQIDLGKEKRQIVAGIRAKYGKEELVGRNIIVLCNLKKAKLRGIESNGMLLAAEDDENLSLLSAENSSPGDIVVFGDMKNSNKTISIEDFIKVELKVQNARVFYDGKEAKTPKEVVSAGIAKDNAKIR